MSIVDLSMTVEECDSAPFAKDEYYFKVRPIVTFEEKGFVSNMVEMTVHAGTHIDTPHHFFQDRPGIEHLPVETPVPHEGLRGVAGDEAAAGARLRLRAGGEGRRL
ncbi:MAG: cyclase family protein [Candidatus Rokubacteria bacterium]|nr:cyclase family protein [Candidatus Rokubacteria bacterium]